MGRTDDVSAGQGPDGRPVFDSYGRLSWNPTTRELEKIETMTNPYKKLLTDLAVANQTLTGYLENVLAVHQGESEPVSPEIEIALGRYLVEVGFRLNQHVIKTGK